MYFSGLCTVERNVMTKKWVATQSSYLQFINMTLRPPSGKQWENGTSARFVLESTFLIKENDIFSFKGDYWSLFISMEDMQYGDKQTWGLRVISDHWTTVLLSISRVEVSPCDCWVRAQCRFRQIMLADSSVSGCSLSENHLKPRLRWSAEVGCSEMTVFSVSISFFCAVRHSECDSTDKGNVWIF